MRVFTLIIGVSVVTACSGRDLSKNGHGRSGYTGCTQSLDCPNAEICFQGNCTATQVAGDNDEPRLPAQLIAAASTLVFGTVNPGNSKRLEVILKNTSDVVATLAGVTLAPVQAPFKLESLGAGPFWIRPQSQRAVFVTFAPTNYSHQQASLSFGYNGVATSVVLEGN